MLEVLLLHGTGHTRHKALASFSDSGSFFDLLWYNTFMWNAPARRAIAAPIPPIPTIPMVAPDTCFPRSFGLIALKAGCAARAAPPTKSRAAASSSANAKSATCCDAVVVVVVVVVVILMMGWW